jgi:hypothetical protein
MTTTPSNGLPPSVDSPALRNSPPPIDPAAEIADVTKATDAKVQDAVNATPGASKRPANK